MKSLSTQHTRDALSLGIVSNGNLKKPPLSAHRVGLSGTVRSDPKCQEA